MDYLAIESGAVDIDSLLESTFQRTSVTVDEAVAMLLGWLDGPAKYYSLEKDPSVEEQEILDSLTFSLHDAIELKGDTLARDYEDARERKLPSLVIAEKRHAELAFLNEIDLARSYLCAIEDELNKGDGATLRLDRTLSTQTFRFITLSSLYRWSRECDEVPELKVAQPQGKAAKPKQPSSTHDKPWFVIDPRDPKPDQPWYTAARYFARQLVKEDSTLLTKRHVLAAKVAQSLEAAGILKRGGVKPLTSDTVKKAFSNVSLG